MQVELPRSKHQYVLSGHRNQSTKALYLEAEEDIFGFDVPRRPRTCVTRPRDFTPLDLWFLPSSKNSTRDSSPVLEDDDDDEEALVAAALFDLANTAAGASSSASRSISVAATATSTLPAARRNGPHNGYNGRVAAPVIGPFWGAGSGTAKRRRSHDLLAADNDNVDVEEDDDHPHSPSPRPSIRDEGPPNYQPGAGPWRRGRMHGPGGPPSGALANGHHYTSSDMRPVATRGGRSTRVTAPAMDEPHENGKPPSAAGAGGRASSESRGPSSFALHGHTSLAAARAAARVAAAGYTPARLPPPPPAQENRVTAGNGTAASKHEVDEVRGPASAVGSVRGGLGLPVKSEGLGGDGSAGVVGEGSEHEDNGTAAARGSSFRPQGSSWGLRRERALEGGGVLGEGAPTACGVQSGVATSGGTTAAAVKSEPGISGSQPVSPNPDGLNARISGCTPMEKERELEKETIPNGVNGGVSRSQYGAAAAALAALGCGRPLASQPSSTPTTAQHPLAELLSSAAAASGPPGAWPGLIPPGLIPGASTSWTPQAVAAAAAELMANGFAEPAGGKTVNGTAPQPHQHPHAAQLQHLQQLHQLHQLHQHHQQQHQHAALKAAAAAAAVAGGGPSVALAAAAAGLPPGSLEYLRALHANGAAAAVLAGHPLALQAAAVAAAAGGAANAGAAGVAGSFPQMVPCAAGGLCSVPSGVADATRGAPFKRCAQHVYIAHFIARQQQQQQQSQRQQGQPSSGGNAGRNGASSSDAIKTISGSPLRRPLATVGVEALTGAEPSACGGGSGTADGAESRDGTSNMNGGASGGATSSRAQHTAPASAIGNGHNGSAVEGNGSAVAGGWSGSGGNSGGRPAAASGPQAVRNKGEADSLAASAPPPTASARSSHPQTPAPQHLQQQPHQQLNSAVSALSAAAAVAAAAGAPGGPGALLQQPGFPMPSPAVAAAMMAVAASGGLPGVHTAAQHQHVVATAAAAAAAAAASGGPLAMPRGGPQGPPQPIAGPLGVSPALPPHLAQLLMGGPPGAAASAGYGLPAFVSGLAGAFAGAGAGASLGPPAAASGPSVVSLTAAAAAAAAAAGVLPPGIGGHPGLPLSAASAPSALASFFAGGGLPPHFAAAASGVLGSVPAGLVLPPQLAQSAAATHNLAATWQQQTGQ